MEKQTYDELMKKKQAMVDKYLRMTKEINCIDLDVIVRFNNSEIEELGVCMAAAVKAFDKILSHSRNADVKAMIKEKMKDQAALQKEYEKRRNSKIYQYGKPINEQ